MDLSALAGIAAGEEVRVQQLANATLDLFAQTLDLVSENAREARVHAAEHPSVRFLPQNDDLRARFKFAEVIGSYATLNTLLDRYAPAYALTRTMVGSNSVQKLSTDEIAMLQEYRDQIQAALENASRQLQQSVTVNFSLEELRELNEILGEARERFHSLETVLGMRLIHDVEQALERLCELREKIGQVQRTLSGIFLIDSEIMFVPANDLARIIEDIFRAIGNPFVVENIDGTLLLAARNLLIQVMSFYAYYGREQIYRVFTAQQGRAGRGKVADYIRQEIRLLFSLCKADNKLILTRVMDSAEREFEISVEAIQNEATNRAIAEVERLLPPTPPAPSPAPPGLLRRLARWLFRPAS
ncbi:MAG: hypothetical protein RLW42_17005 [Gammaproteobacteria bacterium]